MNDYTAAALVYAGSLGTAANALYRSRWWKQRLAESHALLDARRYAEALQPLNRQPPWWSVLAAIAFGLAIGVGIAGLLS